MKSSFHLVRILGIDIGLHYTWIFIFILVAWSLAEGYFPDAYPDWSTATYWGTGILASLLLFVSVLIHEMAHSLVGRARGMPVHSITLFLFGGVSNLEEEPEEAKSEFLMSSVGPLSSLVLAGIFWGIWLTMSGTEGPLGATIEYLAVINALLAGFNLIPAFPLDGGRVFRSILWGATGSLSRATNIASMAGIGIGWLLIAFGVFQVLGGAFLGGLWIAFIGWFLSSAAESSRRQLTMHEYLSGIPVSRIMTQSTESVHPDTSIEKLVRDRFLEQHHRAMPVCDNSHPVGIITITDIKKVPQENWGSTRVRDIMPQGELHTISPQENAEKAFKMLAENDINQLLVTENGQCNGMISRSGILNYLHFRKELGMKPGSGKS